MNIITSLGILVVGIILLIFGLNAADSISSTVSEAVTGTPTDKSIVLIVLGVLCILGGGLGTVYRRR